MFKFIWSRFYIIDSWVVRESLYRYVYIELEWFWWVCGVERVLYICRDMCGSFVKNLVFNNWIKKKLKFKMLILYILFGKRRNLWDIWKCEYLKLLKSDYYIK